jgi:hypothetical protein
MEESKIKLWLTFISIIVGIGTAGWQFNKSTEASNERFEKEMIANAIVLNSKEQTLANLKFLLEMQVISSEKEKYVQNLSDSTFFNADKMLSDDIWGIYFRVLDKNNRPIGGVHVKIEYQDETGNVILNMENYTTYSFTPAEFTYPENFCGKFARITLKKSGYRSSTKEIRLPKIYDHETKIFVLEEKQ